MFLQYFMIGIYDASLVGELHENASLMKAVILCHHRILKCHHGKDCSLHTTLNSWCSGHLWIGSFVHANIFCAPVKLESTRSCCAATSLTCAKSIANYQSRQPENKQNRSMKNFRVPFDVFGVKFPNNQSCLYLPVSANAE